MLEFLGGSTITRFFPYAFVSLTEMILKLEGEDLFNKCKRDIEWELGENFSKVDCENVGVSHYRIQWDNKITFEVKTDSGKLYYIQFYDGNVKIGLGLMKRDHDPNTHYLKIIPKAGI